MAGNAPIVYLDSCVFIAALTGEARKGDEAQHVAGVMAELERRELIAVTSALTRGEILECTLTEQQRGVMERLLRPPKTQIKDVSPPVIAIATEIRNFYQKQKLEGVTNLPTVELPDALHLATAIYFECPTMFTFDENERPEPKSRPKRALIPLSGIIAERFELKIIKPYSASKGLDFGR